MTLSFPYSYIIQNRFRIFIFFIKKHLTYKTDKLRQLIRFRKISWSMQSGNSFL